MHLLCLHSLADESERRVVGSVLVVTERHPPLRRHRFSRKCLHVGKFAQKEPEEDRRVDRFVRALGVRRKRLASTVGSQTERLDDVNITIGLRDVPHQYTNAGRTVQEAGKQDYSRINIYFELHTSDM